MMVGKSIKMRQPSFGCRKYKRISKKKATSPMSSAASSFAVKGNRQSQPSALKPGPSQSESEQTPRLSDVPCYTCRRRHVKCDRILPHCAKCAKKGVACLGYRKPLRWAEGVAVRGKLKGKAQPVVDSEVLSTSRAILDQSRAAVRTEAAQYGLAPLTLEGEEASVDTIRLRVIRYFNTVMCAKHVEAPEHPLASDRLAHLTPQIARALPKDFLNCIVGISAIHMSIRNPGNSAVTRLALEMKNELFEGINTAFLQPQTQRADVLFICTALMFAMELIENGNPSKWGTHYNGAINLIILHGGIKRFASYYPHLKPLLAAISQMQIMLITINAAPFEFVDLISRNDLKSICFDPKIRKGYFLSIPLRLLNANYDMAGCARNIFANYDHCPSVADVYSREWVLADVLRFSPEDGMPDVRNYMYSNRAMTEAEVQAWTMIFRAWRGAMTVVVLRHLYFGLPHAEMASSLSQASTPMMQAQTLGQDLSFSSVNELLQDANAPVTGYQSEEVVDSYFDLGRLSPEAHFTDSFSQTPSPLPSPRPPNETIEFDHWSRRYQIHNDAVSELCGNLTALVTYGHVSFLRHAILPLLVLSLVSRSGTFERTASIDLFEQFKRYMASMASAPNPIGGPPMELDIPWGRLDAFSAEVEQQRFESIIYVEDELHNSAPEWNWRYMLQHIEIDTAWPCTAGPKYMELGQEFWAFGVLAQCCNEEAYAAFSRQPFSASQSSSSSV